MDNQRKIGDSLNRLHEREAHANTLSTRLMECPDCGVEALPIEPDDVRTDLNTRPLSLTETLFEIDEGTTIDGNRHCWVCGYQEVRTVTVESVDSQAGDEAIIDQEHLLSQFESEINRIKGEDGTTIKNTLGRLQEV